MRILITEQFNKAARKLNHEDQKSLFALFGRLESTTKEDIFNSGKLIKLHSSDEKIFMIRDRHLRVFCTFETEREEDDLILLDVARKDSSRLRVPFNLTRLGSRTR